MFSDSEPFTLSRYRRRLGLAFFLRAVRFITLGALLTGTASQLFILATNLRSHQHKVESIGTPFWEGSPGIPRAPVGAVYGFALGRCLSVVALLLTAVSECPFPKSLHHPLQRLWDLYFPPYSDDRGVGVAGLMMLGLGSFDLGENTVGFPRAAAWLLLVMGLLNCFLGITLRSRIHKLRLIPDAEERSLPLPASTRNSLDTLRNPSMAGSVYECPPVPETASVTPSTPRRTRFGTRPFWRPFSAHTSASASVYSVETQEGMPHGGSSPGARPPMPQFPSGIVVPPEVRWSERERTALGPMVQIRR